MKIAKIKKFEDEIIFTIEDDQGYTIDIMLPEDRSDWVAPESYSQGSSSD